MHGGRRPWPWLCDVRRVTVAFVSTEREGSMLVERMRPFTSTIFAAITAEAVRSDAVNLGQGFPDTDGPESMLEAARRAITEDRKSNV